MAPSLRLALLTAAVAVSPTLAAAQSAGGAPERAIRRDIPLTNAIRQAYAAGTRDTTGRPGPNYWQLRVDYTIAASLDPRTSVVTGQETILIHNTTGTPLDAVHLRLDQNIFAANVPRLETVPEITEGMVVTRMAFEGQPVNLTPPPRAFRPGGAAPAPQLAAYGLNLTTARVSLPAPIAPGATASLEIDWNYRVTLSEGGRGLRQGRWGDSLYQVAQWYPRVAVYDDLRGWNVEPYLGPSEFYNNFGKFDVTLDVPAGWVVGATGVLQNPEQVLTPTARERLSHVLESDQVVTIVGPDEFGAGRATAAGDRLTWHFAADTVNDFAWATSRVFVWDATRATIPGGEVIPVHIMYPPGHTAGFVEVGPRTRHALEFYSGLWMPYAFPQLTVVDGPDTGMEYPMFIMSALGAADHEAGHEWWPMMVGTNETWYGFMDEGFNQYMNTLSSAHRRGEAPNLDGPGQRYGQISGNEEEGPLMSNANHGGPMYSFQAYLKAPLMLSMLGGIVGDSAVWTAMSGYAHAWRFRHPSPWDYANFMSHALGRDLGWFWNAWLFTTERVDGSIQGMTTAGGRTTVAVRQDGEMPSPVVLKVRFARGSAPIRPMANAVMVDDSTAMVTWPVDVWFAGSRTFQAVLEFGTRPITEVILDPRCRFPDADPKDNIWPRRAAVAAPAAGGFGPSCNGS
jgi:hypothetical protein